MTGRSVTLDPRIHAVRADLADVRLAGQVFAPHFAAPVACRIARTTPLLRARLGDEVAATLEAGAAFELLDLAGGLAWGRAPGPGLVGYVDRDALAAP